MARLNANLESFDIGLFSLQNSSKDHPATAPHQCTIALRDFEKKIPIFPIFSSWNILNPNLSRGIGKTSRKGSGYPGSEPGLETLFWAKLNQVGLENNVANTRGKGK